MAELGDYWRKIQKGINEDKVSSPNNRQWGSFC